jgi:hypothetical protein
MAVGGCGGAGKPVKVSGILTLDGKPFPGATITFTPAEGSGKPAGGRSEVDGSFQLTTYKPDDGALPGDYKVSVTYQEGDKTLGDQDPGKMSDKEKTAFFRRLSPQGRARDEKKKASTAVPTVYTSATTTPLRVTVPAGGKVELTLRSTAR